jgi:class 3 adenylate cyclase/pimeloyl-ACP methyl ester carboxylesterase
MEPTIEYALSGDVNIAYTVLGDGKVDLLFLSPWASNLDIIFEYPAVERGLETIAGIGRMITFDRRGAGLSDRLCGPGTLEESMDDALAVLDAVGCEKVAVMAVHEAGPLAMLLAATHPDRVSSLVLYGSFASTTWHEDYPWGQKPEERDVQIAYVVESWGKPEGIAGLVEPTLAGDSQFHSWWAKWQRNSTSKEVIKKAFEIAAETDVRPVLGAIKVPTLILHRPASPAVPIENAYYLHEHIAGSKLVELDGEEFLPFLGDSQSIVDEIEEFLTGSRTRRESERILSTLLFADIVDSTSSATQLGDQRWKDLLDQIDARVGTQVDWHGGRLVKQLGDGYLAMFDRPAQAVRCAARICREAKALGIELRSGLHTGEVELRGEDIGGIAVHIAARVMDAAQPGEILVSGALPPLVAGSGIRFEERGKHELKGVEGSWELFAVN